MKSSDLEGRGNSGQPCYPCSVQWGQEKIFELKLCCFTVDVVITIRIKFT